VLNFLRSAETFNKSLASIRGAEDFFKGISKIRDKTHSTIYNRLFSQPSSENLWVVFSFTLTATLLKP
jgi:hypothetical protein